jgi:hypothetical protein
MGLLLDPQDCLRRMVSRCFALQTWQGNTFTESQLLDRVYLDTIPDPANGNTHTIEELNAIRRFALVGFIGDTPIRILRDAMGGGSSFTAKGSLLIMLEQNAIGDNESEIDRNFIDTIESFLHSGDPAQPGLIDQLDRADSLAIQEITCEGIYRVQPEDEISKGIAQRAYFRVEWGVQ